MSSVIQQLCLAVLALVSMPVWAEDPGATDPEVRAVLFYSPDSPQYQDLFAFFLPSLLEQYGERLEVAAIDASQLEGGAAYGTAAARYGVSPQWDGTPVVLVGERSMAGLMEIAAGLGDDFDTLAGTSGAGRWPSLPELEPLLAAGMRDFDQRTTRESTAAVVEQPRQASSGGLRFSDILALVVLVAMVLTLIHSLMRLRPRGSDTGPAASLVLMLALLAGLGISGYTAYTALFEVALMCGPDGGCGDVQKSEYAKLFGIPMGVLGLVGYASILFSWLLARRLSPQGGGWRWVPWAIALFAVLFSLRLTALGYFVIGASCLWCLGSAVCVTLAFWLLSGETRAYEVEP